MVQPKRTVFTIFSTVVFLAVAYLLLIYTVRWEYFWIAFLAAAFFSGILLAAGGYCARFCKAAMLKKTVRSGAAAEMAAFSHAVHFSYTDNDIIKAIRIFEKNTSGTIVFSEQSSGVQYADWERTKPVWGKQLEDRFQAKKKGCFFFNGELCRCTRRFARGVVIKSKDHYLFIFFPAVAGIHIFIVKKLVEELGDFSHRAAIFDSLSHTGLLAKEWTEIEKTQYSFLLKKMPTLAALEAAAYFLPLANVSGDYYLVLPINESKTLLLLGDVSGKGLAAALVMGVVINAVKMFENREDLPGIVDYVDKAIKFMHLQEKFTVLFVGIVDTAVMELEYVNASIADSLVIRPAEPEPRILELKSNCPLLGIIDLPPIQTAAVKLFPGDMILLSSDGVSEIGYANGVCFGDTDLYKSTLLAGAFTPPQAFVEHLANTAVAYGNNSRLRDDITILAVRVAGVP